MSNGKTFIKVSNNDIYNEIKFLRNELEEFKFENIAQHNDIKKCHINNKSQITLIKWVSGSALSISVFLVASILVGKIGSY